MDALHVSGEWLDAREKMIRKNRRITLLVWATNYIAPLFLLFAPYLGLKVNPAIHYARYLQIVMGLGLVVFVTIWYGKKVMLQSDALKTIESIRKRPISGFYDVV